MSYQVLARKWRPRNFEQMVGQTHVLRALVNALEEGRLHHAYLFTGTRGVGKTTVARVLAKCLNCETGITARPCGECAACREIDEGRFVDLIEVDAASRTKVEDTRELLDNVQYAPTRGRYKIYLIDEVHMLSGHSFNALLKTLEEPPPHVKFLLATTDPQRLPVTILSRCLQFSLKRMPASMIVGHLAHILEQEGIRADSAALDQIAVAADGSMRDALSLLDQAIAFGGGEVRDAEVRDMLGGIAREHVFGLLDAVAGGDGRALIEAVAKVAEQAPDFEGVLDDLISLLHQVALAQVVPEALDSVESDAARLRALAGRLAPEDVQLYYQIALMGRRDLPLNPNPQAGFEMVLLRMQAFRPVMEGAPAPAGGPEAAAPASAREAAMAAVQADRPAQKKTPDAAPRVSRPLPVEPAAPAEARATPAPSAPAARAPEPAPEPPAWEDAPPWEDTPSPAAASVAASDAASVTEPAPVPAAGPAADPAAGRDLRDIDWHAVVNQLGLRAMARSLAANCSLRAIENGRVVLALARSQESLRTQSVEARIEKALCEHFGETLKLVIEVVDQVEDTPAQMVERGQAERQQAAERSIEEDSVARALRETFGAELIPGSVRPLTSK
ncbi:MAG: DNA polymerase III subunit gamma/tau [Gammaproteobacteria bacterium]|nr:DNA polymerase III subunit gamma/tau [Gammaproteobacteria bacterium]